MVKAKKEKMTEFQAESLETMKKMAAKAEQLLTPVSYSPYIACELNRVDAKQLTSNLELVNDLFLLLDGKTIQDSLIAVQIVMQTLQNSQYGVYQVPVSPSPIA